MINDEDSKEMRDENQQYTTRGKKSPKKLHSVTFAEDLPDKSDSANRTKEKESFREKRRTSLSLEGIPLKKD